MVVVARERGRGKGSGIAVDVHTGAVWSFRDGMVVKVQLYEEPEQAFEAARGDG